jgi:cytochrome c oxidase assembly protein Cox11
MVYVYVSMFLVWNMLMASVLTIPLYKIVCSVSYLDNNTLSLIINKEYAQLEYFNYNIFELSTFNDTQCLWLRSEAVQHFFSYHDSNSRIECVVHMPKSDISLIHDVSFSDMDIQFIDIRFISRVSNMTLLEFISLQRRIIANIGETTLVFFRMYNPTSFDILGISMYYVFPSISSIYINKIQCFCFDLSQIYSNETVELPVLFYISRSEDMSIFNVIISYVYFVH